MPPILHTTTCVGRRGSPRPTPLRRRWLPRLPLIDEAKELCRLNKGASSWNPWQHVFMYLHIKRPRLTLRITIFKARREIPPHTRAHTPPHITNTITRRCSSRESSLYSSSIHIVCGTRLFCRTNTRTSPNLLALPTSVSLSQPCLP